MGKKGAADAFRIQLEGRLEVIEQAQALTEELTRRLDGWGWERKLRRGLSLLEAVRAREPEVVEALEGVERRARQERWPEDHPVRELLRELKDQRKQLDWWARERLGGRAHQERSSLAEVLDALGGRAREAQRVQPPRPLEAGGPPRPGELLLLTGQQGRFLVTRPRVFLWLVVMPLASCVFSPFLRVAGGWNTVWTLEQFKISFVMCALVLVLYEWAFTRFKRPGRFWLTRERLIWQPRWGSTVEVKLASIPPTPDSITLSPWRNEVRVEGERRLVLPYLNQPHPLVRMLHLLRSPTASVPTDAELQVRDVLILRALRGKDRDAPPSAPGVLVFRPGYAAFLSTDEGPEGPRLSGVLEGLLQGMRAWPPAEFDTFVEGAAREREGALWTHAQLLEALPTFPLTYCRLIDPSGRAVEGDVSMPERKALFGMVRLATEPGPA